MSDDENGVTVTPPERYAIGISFGNSNSSIAHTASVRALMSKVSRETAHKRERMVKLELSQTKREVSLDTEQDTARVTADALRQQIARSPQYSLTSKARSTMELRQRRSWCEIARIR